MLDKTGSLIANLSPGYFALVMSTGIVSISCQQLGFQFLALPLFWLNVGLYLLLLLLYLIRLALYEREVLADFHSHSRGVGFFTMVAGTCILGTQFVMVLYSPLLAVGLFCLGGGLWLFFIYGLLTAFSIREIKPSLAQGISGTWLMATVSTQSISILISLLSPQFQAQREPLLFLAFCLFLVGGFFYFLIIALIFYRFMFLSLDPGDFTPPYWINMGAMAISAFAGSILVSHSQGSPFLQQVLHLLMGATVFFWAIATWWIPFIVILEAWRYCIKKVDFSYSDQYWGMVFPLGMYTTCTVHLAEIAQLTVLMAIAQYFIYVALTAWSLTFLGLVRSLWRTLGPEI